MSLFKQWLDLAGADRDEKESIKFWESYYEKETKAYEDILSNHTEEIEGKYTELAEKFNMNSVEFVGFLDGINTSLKEQLDIENLEESNNIKLDVDFRKLYYNMLDAKADWLYELPQWDNVLTVAERKEIKKTYGEDHRAKKKTTVGRNDPCPCGSGKKYKQCCLGKE